MPQMPQLPRTVLAFVWAFAAMGGLASSQDAADPERRIIAYIKENLKPGEPLIVSKLYNEVFTTPEERAVLDKLNGAFFRVPLFIIEFEGREKPLAYSRGDLGTVRLLRRGRGGRRPLHHGVRPARPEVHHARSRDARALRDRHRESQSGRALQPGGHPDAGRLGRTAASRNHRDGIRRKGAEPVGVRRPGDAGLRLVHQLPAVREDRSRARGAPGAVLRDEASRSSV